MTRVTWLSPIKAGLLFSVLLNIGLLYERMNDLLVFVASTTSVVIFDKSSTVSLVVDDRNDLIQLANETEGEDEDHGTPSSEPSTSVIELATNQTDNTSSPTTTDQATTVNIHKNQVILFSHIGKTGGVTVRSQMEVGCRAFKSKPPREQCLGGLKPSAVSDQVKGYFHVGSLTGLPPEDATGFLYPVRDPVDRIISWYMQIHPANVHYVKNGQSGDQSIDFNATNTEPHIHEFFIDCFWDLNDFTEALLEPMDSRCTKVARKALSNKNLGHIYYNYHYYTHRTMEKFPEKDVYAIRTEYLWEDFNSLNRLLGGGNKTTINGATVDHGSSITDLPVTNRTISPTGLLGLCCALRDEIEVYETILLRAKNLQNLDIKQHRCHEVLKNSTDLCSDPTDNSPSLFLTHVGRTGGVAVRSLTELGCNVVKNKRRRQRCLGQLPTSDVSDSVKGYLHVGARYGVSAEQASGYLFTIRDPLERIISWYLQTHPANTQFKDNAAVVFDVSLVQSPLSEFFLDCFWDLNSYAEALGGSGDDGVCNELVHSVPKSRKMGHLFFNYEFYATRTITRFPEKDVYAIRTEHMQKDFDSINILLGGRASANVVVKKENEALSVPNIPVTNRTLSATGLLGLCCSLRKEIKVYETILRRAKNIDDPDLNGHRCFHVLESGPKCDP